MLRKFIAILVIVASFALNDVAFAGGSTGIAILSGSYGKPGSAHRLDIADRLQTLCGADGTTCDVWCSQTSFGGRDLGRHALCRVIYRCPDESTRSTEASGEEPILMRCPAPDAEDRSSAPAN